MHRTGHWLGLDVHDVGDYKVDSEWRMLEAGMVLTVEPGIYTGDNRKIAKKWRNIGIRIEDDVRVTRTGCEVLTLKAPKTIAEIEAVMAAANTLLVKKAVLKKSVAKKKSAKSNVKTRIKTRVKTSVKTRVKKLVRKKG
jgi:hypothetical protein